MVVFHPPPSLILYASDVNFDGRFARNHIKTRTFEFPINEQSIIAKKERNTEKESVECKAGQFKLKRRLIRAGRVVN